jgi:nicotinamide mononucleotide adenylyltransferase
MCNTNFEDVVQLMLRWVVSDFFMSMKWTDHNENLAHEWHKENSSNSKSNLIHKDVDEHTRIFILCCTSEREEERQFTNSTRSEKFELLVTQRLVTSLSISTHDLWDYYHFISFVLKAAYQRLLSWHSLQRDCILW